MPWSNLNNPIEKRRALKSIIRKSQLWAGFLIPSITFLVGFFKNDLSSVEGLLACIAISLFLFVAAMELADYSDVQWQLSITEFVYCVAAMVLFWGVAQFLIFQGSLGAWAYLFYLPFLFYVFRLVLAVRIFLVIYRRHFP